MRIGEFSTSDHYRDTEPKHYRSPMLPCFCKGKQVRLNRIERTVDEMGEEGIINSSNFIDVCINKECFRYVDRSQMPSWRPIK